MIKQLGSVVEMFSGGPGAQHVVPPVGSATSHPLAPKYCSVQHVSFTKQFAWPMDVLVGGHGFRGTSASTALAEIAKRRAEDAFSTRVHERAVKKALDCKRESPFPLFPVPDLTDLEDLAGAGGCRVAGWLAWQLPVEPMPSTQNPFTFKYGTHCA